jgi:hypothetical protein
VTMSRELDEGWRWGKRVSVRGVKKGKDNRGCAALAWESCYALRRNGMYAVVTLTT